MRHSSVCGQLAVYCNLCHIILCCPFPLPTAAAPESSRVDPNSATWGEYTNRRNKSFCLPLTSSGPSIREGSCGCCRVQWTRGAKEGRWSHLGSSPPMQKSSFCIKPHVSSDRHYSCDCTPTTILSTSWPRQQRLFKSKLCWHNRTTTARATGKKKKISQHSRWGTRLSIAESAPLFGFVLLIAEVVVNNGVIW